MTRVFMAFMTALLVTPLLVSAAFAHAVLLDGEPKGGGAYAAPPDQARLRFNEPVAPVVVRLLAPDGSSHVLEPHATDNEMTAPLPKYLGNGTYVLSYRVISLDSHPVAGSLVFAIGADAPVAPEAKTNGVPHWEGAFPYIHGVALIALFLAVGGTVFTAFVLPDEAKKSRAVSRYARIAAAVGAIAAIASVGVRGAGLADSPLVEIFTATPWRIALSTAMGPGLALTLLACAVAAIATFARAGLERLLAIAGLGALAWGLAITSHAALAPPAALSYPAYMAHVAVAAFWLGSLPLLAVALSREPLRIAVSTVAVFSRVAIWAVAALLIAGVVLIAVQTGPDLSVWLGPAWRNTPYGGVLAAKLVAVLIVLALALRNNWVLTPLLAKGHGASRLRRSIVVETAVMVAVIGCAAVLASSEPPRSVSAAALLAEHHAANADSGAVIDATRDGVEILLEVDPATPGPNQMVVHFFDAAKGEHLAPSEVTVAVSLPAGGVEPLRRAALPKGDGTYRVESMPLPVAGTWEVRIEALLTDFDKLIVTMELPIGVVQ